MTTTHLTTKDYKLLWRNLKNSAIKRGIEFTLTPSDIDDIGIPITCPILGIPLHFNQGTVKDDSISFDRIDSSKGYTRDNVIIVSYRVNKLKSDATLNEMKLMVDYYSSL